MKKLNMMLLCAAMAAATATAQTPSEGPDLGPEITPGSVTTTTETPLSASEASQPGAMNWYNALDYDGFDFELPAGCNVERTPKLLAVYPDGTFGVSILSTEESGLNQKRAETTCKKLAQSMEIEKPYVQKVSYGKAKGAQATGFSKGQTVTVIVLPYGGRETKIVVLNTEGRRDWKDHFLSTLKR